MLGSGGTGTTAPYIFGSALCMEGIEFPPSAPSNSESSSQWIVVDLQLTLARNVRLSGMSLISSPSSPPDVFLPSSCLATLSPSLLSLVFDSAADASSCAPAGSGDVASFDEPSSGVAASSLIPPFFPDSSTGLLAPATIVVGSAVSRALRRT